MSPSSVCFPTIILGLNTLSFCLFYLFLLINVDLQAGVAVHRSLGEVSDHKGRAHIGEAEQRGAQVPVGGVQGAPGEGREEPGGLGQPATPHTEGGGGGY